MKTQLILWSVVFGSAILTCAQQTNFNVPTVDVLDRGKVYTEIDAAFKRSDQPALNKPQPKTTAYFRYPT